MKIIKSHYLQNEFESKGRVINKYYSLNDSDCNFRKLNEGEKVLTFVTDSMVINKDGSIQENIKWFPVLYNKSNDSFMGIDGNEYQSTLSGLKIYRFPYEKERRYYSSLSLYSR